MTGTALERQYDRISAIQDDLRRALAALNLEETQVPDEVRGKLHKAEMDLVEVISDVSVTLAYLNLEGTRKCSEQ